MSLRSSVRRRRPPASESPARGARPRLGSCDCGAGVPSSVRSSAVNVSAIWRRKVPVLLRQPVQATSRATSRSCLRSQPELISPAPAPSGAGGVPTTRVLAITLAACLTASIAAAQEPTSAVTLLPAAPSRWDVAAHVTWLGERRTGPSFTSDRWINVASGGGIVGYYWTSHLKTSSTSPRPAKTRSTRSNRSPCQTPTRSFPCTRSTRSASGP